MKQTLTLVFALGTLLAHAQMTHEIHVVDNEFQPEVTVADLGDSVIVVFDATNHTFTQVSHDTWNLDGDIPLPGGYQFFGAAPPNNRHAIFLDTLSTIYYVCEFHVSSGMKGQILVVEPLGLDEPVAPNAYQLAPNPAADRVGLRGAGTPVLLVTLYDATGRMRWSGAPEANNSISVADLPQGLYFAELLGRNRQVLAYQRLVVER